MIDFPIDSDATITVTGLRDAIGSFVNDAVVIGRLYQGATPIGGTFTFSYVPASDGNYVATIGPQHLKNEAFYALVVTATSGGKQLIVRCRAKAIYAAPIT